MARKFSVMFALLFVINIFTTNILRTNIFAQEVAQESTQKAVEEVAQEATQEAKPVQKSSPVVVPASQPTTPVTTKPTPMTDVLPPKKKKKKQKVIQEPIPSNVGLSKKSSSITALRLEWQFANVPEDSMFAYEKRYIPFLNPPEDFMAPQVEKEIIVERIEEEKVDYKKLAKKYVPNTLQIIVISIVFIIFIIYRMQISSNKKRRKIFKVKK